MVVSLGAGLVVAWIVDGLNPSIWTQRELERWLGKSVTIEIPRLLSPADLARDRKRKLLHAGLYLTLGVAYVGGLYYLYARQSGLLRLLDPIIERITQRVIG